MDTVTLTQYPQYLDVLSSEIIVKNMYKICILDVLSSEIIEKNLYKICLFTQILYIFFTIISLDKTSRYCGYIHRLHPVIPGGHVLSHRTYTYIAISHCLSCRTDTCITISPKCNLYSWIKMQVTLSWSVITFCLKDLHYNSK
jgi:hypothetical protein